MFRGAKAPPAGNDFVVIKSLGSFLRQKSWLIFLFWWGTSLALAAESAEPFLPPLTGELSGDFTALKFEGAPKMHWTLKLKPGDPGQRFGEAVIEGAGIQIRAEAQLDAVGNGSWHILAAEVDIAAWFAALAPSIGPDLVGLVAEGKISLTGAGTVRDKKLAGQIHLELRDGAIRDEAKGWAIEGIALRGDLGALPALSTANPVVITFREGTAAGVAFRDGVIELKVDADQAIHITRATCALMDGSLEIEPFTFSPARPEVASNVRFTDLELGRIANLLPPVLAEAQGRVSGSMSVGWSRATGFKPGNGRLQIKEGEFAALKLSPQPGFLTSHVPKRLSLLPAWLGPIARAFSPENPAYETLRAIEMGEMRLAVGALDVGLQPDGDPNGRTARVVLLGRPEKSNAVESLRFEINVVGPLADVVRLGLEGRISAHTR